jgi:ribosome-associated translation inhibitor RaiA
MPVGRVQRLDADRGYAAIVRSGREYDAPLDEIESRARVVGARVHFDVKRRSGVEAAANVRLRRGRRSNRRQRRFGDLTGARRPGEKVATTAATELGVDVSTQSLDVARVWADAIARGDTDGALSLYAPDADLHTGEGTAHGRRELGTALEALPAHGRDLDHGARGIDLLASVEWDVADVPAARMVVDRGQIHEQWIGVEPPTADETIAAELVSVVHHGRVGDDVIAYASQKVGRVMETAGGRGRDAVVKLVMGANPAMANPASAEATIDLDGSVVRAQVASTTLLEAVDLLEARLRRRVERDTEHARPQSTRRPPQANEWRRGDRPSVRPDHFARPVGERELVRHKTFAPGDLTVEEALFDMGMLDYDFFLFHETTTGADAVLWYADGEVYLRLAANADGDPDLGASGALLDGADVATATVGEAIERLDAGGEPFVFFRNRRTGEGNVAYRRYDGHYGLVTRAR